MAFTRIESCFICEAVRPELFNKNILLGFFGMAPYVTVRLQNARMPAALCFVFCGGPSVGTFNVRLRILDPDGTEVTNPTNAPPIPNGQLNSPKGGTNIFLAFFGILGTAGTFRASLLIDDAEVYSTTFGIEEVTQPATLIH